MVPPQDRPTFHAVSSATPNSSILGLPLSITSMASVTTAPSTQPPDTEPRKLPSLSITRLEPTGRGAEPQVSTTVASATSRPALRHSSAPLRMSSSRVSIARTSVASRHLQHLLWIMALGGRPGQRAHQICHRLQIVDRPQFINMGQHGAHAFGAGFKSLEAQQ